MPQTFDEDDQIFTPAAAISNLSGGVYNATAENTINAILAALRAANIIAED